MSRLVKAVRTVFVFDVAFILIQIATRSLLAKNLSMSEFGLFTLLITIASFVTALISPDIAITRYVAVNVGCGEEKEVKAWVRFSVVFGVMIGSIGGTAIFLFSNVIATQIFHRAALSPLIKIVALSIVIGVPWHLSSAALRGLYRFREASLTAFSQQAIFLVFVVFAVFVFRPGGSGAFILFVVSYLFSLAANLFFLRHDLLRRTGGGEWKSFPAGFKKKMEETVKYYAPLVIKSVGSISTARFGHLVIASVLPLAQLGAYGAVYPLATISGFLVRSASEPLTADFSEREGRADEEAKRDLYLKSSRFFLFSSFLLAFGAFVFSEELIVLFFTKSYLIALPAFVLLLLAEAFNSITTPATRLLYAEGETMAIGLASLSAGVSTVVLSLLLVGPLGITGAALASLISFALYAATYFGIVYWKKKWWFGWISIVVPLGSAVSLYVLAGYVQLFELAFFFKLVFASLGALVYLLLGWGTRIIEVEEIKKILFALAKR